MSIRAKNRRPTHPGAILREDVLPSLSITQTDLADHLGVSRRTVSQILHEQRPLTVDMAIRLSRFLGTTPESWLNMQQALDIWDLQHKNARVYQQIERKAS
jgi:addiction module HigA family antidote